MNTNNPNSGDAPPWTTTLTTSFGESDEHDAAQGARLWSGIRWQFHGPEGSNELELRFDDTIQTLVGYFAKSAIHASEGDKSLARHARWEFAHDDKRIDRGEGPVVLRPLAGDAIAVDVVAFDDPDEAYVGRLDPDIEVQSQLPAGPISVRFNDVLTVLAEAGNEALAMYRKQEAPQTDPYESLSALVRDVGAALETVDSGSFTGFDTALERYEELLLENPTSAEDVHGPIRDEWLVNHALETDVLERLIDERIRPAGAETARRWYKALIMIGDEVTEQSLDVLAADPDQRAIGGLLLLVWDDDPQFAPQAVSILGTLLADHDAFEETREDRQHVLQQIENLSTRSDHPRVRAAAVEALGEVGHPCSRSALETAREDSDPDVRAAAETALEQLNDRQNGG